nr:stromal 70 kda heat shock-related protein, chloroplastic [Quercus suber]
MVLRVVNKKVDGINLGTTNTAMEAKLLRVLNMKMGSHGQQIPPLCRGLDVSPLSLGLETLGGVMTKIIPRNTTLPTSNFSLNIPPAPRGVPQIEVKFCINLDGILSVTAIDKGTGEKQGFGIINLPNTKLMQRMVNEAERFAKHYKEKRNVIDTKNQAESVVY